MFTSRLAASLLAVALAGAGWIAPASAAPPSTTTLVLSSGQTSYGQTVTATAQVATSNGQADGDVLFTFDGVATKANVNGGGTATLALPRDAAVGAHTVSAAFVPRLPGQEPSTSPTVAWTVSQVRTRLQVRVTGRGARVRTSVVVAAAGEYGTVPTGTVRVRVRRDGRTPLDEGGATPGRGRDRDSRSRQARRRPLPPRADVRRRRPAPPRALREPLHRPRMSAPPAAPCEPLHPERHSAVG